MKLNSHTIFGKHAKVGLALKRKGVIEFWEGHLGFSEALRQRIVEWYSHHKAFLLEFLDFSSYFIEPNTYAFIKMRREYLVGEFMQLTLESLLREYNLSTEEMNLPLWIGGLFTRRLFCYISDLIFVSLVTSTHDKLTDPNFTGKEPWRGSGRMPESVFDECVDVFLIEMRAKRARYRDLNAIEHYLSQRRRRNMKKLK